MNDDVIMPPVHPGEILLTEFLEPLKLSQYQLARSIAVPARRINEIVHGQRRISADTALRLARFFGTSERFWMNLQSRYDLEIEKDRLGPVLDEIRPLTAASLCRPRLSAWLVGTVRTDLPANDPLGLRAPTSLNWAVGAGDGNLFGSGLPHGLTCGSVCPRVTVRDRSSPGLTAR